MARKVSDCAKTKGEVPNIVCWKWEVGGGRCCSYGVKRPQESSAGWMVVPLEVSSQVGVRV